MAKFDKLLKKSKHIQVKMQKKGLEGDYQMKSVDDIVFPVLEQCFFRRVVLDEFHEAEAQQPMQLRAITALQGHFKWGLTGTPN